MSTQARSIDLKSITRAWEKLQASSGIGPISNEEEYEQRTALLNALIDTVRDDEAYPLASLMEIVGELIENYENTHYPMPEAEPREALQFLMEEHGLKQSDLAEIDSQGGRFRDPGRQAGHQRPASQSARRAFPCVAGGVYLKEPVVTGKAFH